MRDRHDEFRGTVRATAERAFDLLDDQRRLSAHMSTRSWKMGWGRMDVRLDANGGRTIGSHIILDGRVFGIRLYLDEVVTERSAPTHKRWETVGQPRLLVIGPYAMGFDVVPRGAQCDVRVAIDYDLPARGTSRLLGRLFSRSYARWCTKRMVLDAQRALGR